VALLSIRKIPFSFSVLYDVRSINEVFPLECAADANESMMSGKAGLRCVLATGY
jgi:hypothetical protein